MMIFIICFLIRCANISDAALYYSTMFGLSGAPLVNEYTLFCLREFGVFMVASIIFGLPIARWFKQKTRMNDTLAMVIRTVFILTVTAVALSYAVMGGYNPFIYFNF